MAGAGASTCRQGAILVTGPPGVGKTSLVKAVGERALKAGKVVGGFWTEEVRNEGVRIGFNAVDFRSKESAPLATTNPRNPGPAVGKYTVAVQEFENFALKSLDDSAGVEVLLLDELGKMESFSNKFIGRIRRILAEEPCKVVLATVPLARGRPLPIVQEIQRKASSPVVTLTKANRDAMADEVFQLLSSHL